MCVGYKKTRHSGANQKSYFTKFVVIIRIFFEEGGGDLAYDPFTFVVPVFQRGSVCGVYGNTP